MWLLFRTLLFFYLPYFVALDQQLAYEYNPNNFYKQIEILDGNFIMFYAPWCSHCTEFQPIWRELAELVNTHESRFAIAQVDCTLHQKLCGEIDITGYPTLLYFHKNTFQPVEYKGTRDLVSLTLFLSEVFTLKSEIPQSIEPTKKINDVRIYSGMAYLDDQNVEKFLSKGQHFVMFYTPWCKVSQRLSPIWAELAMHYAHNDYVQISKINCVESHITCENFDVKHYPYLLWIANGRPMGMANNHYTLEALKSFVELMSLSENHDPEKFTKKKKSLPVARITEDTFDAFFDTEIIFVNYFAPWCSHCMQLSPLWTKLGERFLNESRVLVADIDCSTSRAICAIEKINGLPTLVLYKNKKIVHMENGGKPLTSLVSLIQQQLDGTTSTKEDKDKEQTSSEETSNIVSNDDTPASIPAKDEL